MGFLEFLKQNDALSEGNLTHPKLDGWVKKYLEAFPVEQQEKEWMEMMARERWHDMEQVLEELEAEKS